MFLELHLLQNFAPSNLNRDDANAPKECVFGCHRRARINSQCILLLGAEAARKAAAVARRTAEAFPRASIPEGTAKA